MLSGQLSLMELEQRLSRVLEIEPAVTEEVVLPGPYAEVAAVNPDMQDVNLVSEFSFVRYDEQASEIPVGMNGLVEDCPITAAVNKEITASDVNMMEED